MSLPPNLHFSCSALTTNHGHEIHAAKPDENGAYDVVVGAVGCPTRKNVIYDTASLVEAMSDTSGRFNICLQDGNLAGEYGHPVIKTKDDINRLLNIDESKISHYFTKIWIDNEHPVTVGGMRGLLIRAKVKPTGPYGEILRKQLEDPNHNTSFSIRSLCLPMNGSNPKYEYRQVQVVVTFDAVHAPGFEVASKRYVPANESWSDFTVSQYDLEQCLDKAVGMESAIMLNHHDIDRIRKPTQVLKCNDEIYQGTDGKLTLLDSQGCPIHAASLIYGR